MYSFIIPEEGLISNKWIKATDINNNLYYQYIDTTKINNQYYSLTKIKNNHGFMIKCLNNNKTIEIIVDSYEDFVEKLSRILESYLIPTKEDFYLFIKI